MRPVDILRVIFIWALLHCVASDNEQRISVLEDEVSTLNKKVEKLESGTIERDDVIRILEQTLAELKDDDSGNTDNSDGNSGKGGNSSGNENIDKEMEIDDTVSPVTFIEVRRELQESSVRFTVKYTPDVEEYTIIWKYGFNAANHSDESLSDGSRETSILVPPSLKKAEDYQESSLMHASDVLRMVSVTFSHPSGDGVLLMLRNVQGDAVQRNITLPILKVKPEGDLVYDDGEDIIFTVSTPILGDKTLFYGSLGPAIGFEGYLRSPETGRLVVVTEKEQAHMELIGNQTFSDHHDWELKIKTSEFKTRGILIFTTSFESQMKTSLLMGSMCHHVLVIRPLRQKGPFPLGYMDIIRNRWSSYSEDGSRQESCRSDQDRSSCVLECKVVGDHITEVTVDIMLQDGSATPAVNIRGINVTQEPTYSKFIRTILMSFPSNLTTNTLRFRCQAFSATGETAHQNIDVFFSEPINFMRNESEIQILHMNDTLVELKIICKLKAYPLPNVTFTLDTYGSYDYDVKPSFMFYDGEEKEVVAVKYFTYDPSDPYNVKRKYQPKLSKAECTASSEPPTYDYANFVFDMPEEIKD